MLPQDPFILLSFVNTRLRDRYASLRELCEDLEADEADLTERLGAIGCSYGPEHNQFV